MVLNQTSRINTVTIALISLQLLLLSSIFISPVFGFGLFDNNSNYKSITRTIKSTSDIQQHQKQKLKNTSNHHDNDKHDHEKNNNDHDNNNIKLSSTSSQSSSSAPSTPRLGISTSDLTPSLAEDMGLPKKSKGAVVQ